jgi:carbon storage regulator
MASDAVSPEKATVQNQRQGEAAKCTGGLTLNRKVGERIRVGHEIIVEVRSVNGNFVRISIRAPKNLSIDREEVYLKKQAAREAARRKKQLKSAPSY